MRALPFHRGIRSPAVLVALLATLVGCRGTPVPSPASGASPAARFYALLVNGGADRARNYQSHFLHLRELLAVLHDAGVPSDHVTVFSSDGTDPEPDLAVRELQPERDFWLLEYTHVGGPLATPITYVNSVLPGVRLEAATRANLGAWFAGAGRGLRSGDTLLVYVTDHGSKNVPDPTDNRITLWGENESLAVHELRDLLGRLDPGVRVVMLMSQCYSGAFASLRLPPGPEQRGGVCGYFSSTADRPAYGCYPENRGRENVGHSFHFIATLAATGRFADAHRNVLAADRSPDVPLRTSDLYLEGLLHAAAGGDGDAGATALADELLRAAWRDKASWEPDIRLLDRVARSFGMFSPRSLAELDEQAQRLPEMSEQLRNYARAWQNGLGDASEASLARFVATHPAWAERLRPDALASLSPADRRGLTDELLDQLRPFTRARDAAARRLFQFHARAQTAAAAAYRMDVRLGAVLRLRAVLEGIAGRVYLATRGTAAERAAYAGLVACENLTLTLPPGRSAPVVAGAPPFPSYADDVERARTVLPAWMGINFQEAPVGTREALDLTPGAAQVTAVYPDSPAMAAGLRPGDTVLGPPGAPFTERNQIRTWTLLAPVGRPAPLAVLRDGEQRTVTLVPRAFPVRWPALPGPVEVGRRAPSLTLSAYRGRLPAADLADGAPHLLFFWATWCAPCKASLPALLAFERSRQTPVIAITDESPSTLDAFFRAFTAPFPELVAVDENRSAFIAYGVNGTPTFVLVDGQGTVRAATTGFEAAKGLQLTP